MLMKKYREGQKELQRFYWLRESRGIVWGKLELAVGVTDRFQVKVGLHQRADWATSCLLSWWTDWQMMSGRILHRLWWLCSVYFEIVICSENREQVEENLERWRYARGEMKVSHSVRKENAEDREAWKWMTPEGKSPKKKKKTLKINFTTLTSVFGIKRRND